MTRDDEELKTMKRRLIELLRDDREVRQAILRALGEDIREFSHLVERAERDRRSHG